jgi:hypothetical protein
LNRRKEVRRVGIVGGRNKSKVAVQVSLLRFFVGNFSKSKNMRNLGGVMKESLFNEKSKSGGRKGWSVTVSIVGRKPSNAKKRFEVDRINGMIRRDAEIGVIAGLSKVVSSGRMRRGDTVRIRRFTWDAGT